MTISSCNTETVNLIFELIYNGSLVIKEKNISQSWGRLHFKDPR